MAKKITPAEYRRILKLRQAGRVSKADWKIFLSKYRGDQGKPSQDGTGLVKSVKYAGAILTPKELRKIENLNNYSQQKRDFAEELRRNMTKTEKMFWKRWQELGYAGLAPQIAVYGYIADFLGIKRRIIIEFDGESHKGREAYDAERDEHLKRCKFNVVRFADDEILENLDHIVEKVRRLVDKASASTPPGRRPLTAIPVVDPSPSAYDGGLMTALQNLMESGYTKNQIVMAAQRLQVKATGTDCPF